MPDVQFSITFPNLKKVCGAQARENAKPKAKFQSLHNFFGPKAEKNPPTVSEPPMVHTAPIPQPSTSEVPSAPSVQPIPPRKGCVLALELLDKLKKNARRIPEMLLVAGDDHPLAIFSGDPVQHVMSGINCWEVVNPMMKAAFGWGLDGN